MTHGRDSAVMSAQIARGDAMNIPFLVGLVVGASAVYCGMQGCA